MPIHTATVCTCVCCVSTGMYWFEMRCCWIFQRRKKEFSHSIVRWDTFVKFAHHTKRLYRCIALEKSVYIPAAVAAVREKQRVKWNEMNWKKDTPTTTSTTNKKNKELKLISLHTLNRIEIGQILSHMYIQFWYPMWWSMYVLTGTVVISNRFRTAVSYYLAKVMFTLHPIAHTSPKLLADLYKYLQLISSVCFWSFFSSFIARIGKIVQMEFRPFFPSHLIGISLNAHLLNRLGNRIKFIVVVFVVLLAECERYFREWMKNERKKKWNEKSVCDWYVL